MLREEGLPSPFDFKPELWPDLGWAWSAWCTLSGRRQVGPGGPTPVQSTEVLAYAALRDWSPDRAEELDQYMQALDATYFRWRSDSREAERQAAEARARAQAERG